MISIFDTKLVRQVISAVKGESSESLIVSKVAGKWDEQTVKYILRYLEHESIVYSDVDTRQQRLFMMV